ncbi:M23 family metallopeptidase [Mycoplasmatota bacterium]|nr:M23 family metallopeptidase [Mycoplasmatota bacterium]
MKNKIVDVVFKKFQSFSFIIFLALILGAFFVLSQLNNSKKDDVEPVGTQTTVTTEQNNQDTNLVEDEVFKLPLDAENPEIARNFYDAEATLDEQLSSIIQVDNIFFINNGVNYTVDKETDFNVLVTLTGTVTKVRQDALVGYLVEVEHLYGIKSVYHSLATVNVAVGDQVEQGDLLGKAGANNYDQDSGIHVHFEVLLGNINLNPNELIGTKISEFDNE